MLYQTICPNTECDRQLLVSFTVVSPGSPAERRTRDYPGSPAEGPDFALNSQTKEVKCSYCGHTQTEDEFITREYTDMLAALVERHEAEP